MLFAGLPFGSASYGYAPAYAAPAAAVSGNVLLLSPRDSDLATLVASSETSTLPAPNLQTMSPRQAWEAAGSEAYVNATFVGGGIAVNGLAINGHNMGPGGVFRARGALTTATALSSPVVDTGWQSIWPVTGMPGDADLGNRLSALFWSNDAVLPAWRFDFADPALMTGLRVGRLAAGRTWQSSYNFDVDAVLLAREQTDVQTRTEYGQIFTDRRSRSAPRRMALAISEADSREVLDGVAEIRRLRGLWGDVFVFADPNARADFHRLSMQAVFITPQEHRVIPRFNDNGDMWTVDLSLREVV